MSYRTCTAVPIIIAQVSLSRAPGIDIVPLPCSTNELRWDRPSRETRWGAQFLGQTVVSVDGKTIPALFRLSGETLQGALRAAEPGRGGA